MKLLEQVVFKLPACLSEVSDTICTICYSASIFEINHSSRIKIITGIVKVCQHLGKLSICYSVGHVEQTGLSEKINGRVTRQNSAECYVAPALCLHIRNPMKASV